MDLVQNVSERQYDELIGGTSPDILTGGIVVASGAGKLERGSVLGQITASGKYKLADSAATDGSGVGSVVLAEDVDATDNDVTTEVYTSGMFNRDKLVFGGTDTAKKQEDNLRIHNIYMTTIH